ncbi:hypothetical protein CDL60_16335 [Roseateles noduli]|nr:hypothetical protein CDL60_16335 [Roseateles noduli]
MEIEVFLALKSAGVPDADARHAATAIRSGVADEVREAQKGGATTADIRALESGISGLKVEMHDLRADFFQRLSDIHKSTLVVTCSSVGLLGVLVTILKFVG